MPAKLASSALYGLAQMQVATLSTASRSTYFFVSFLNGGSPLDTDV